MILSISYMRKKEVTDVPDAERRSRRAGCFVNSVEQKSGKEMEDENEEII